MNFGFSYMGLICLAMLMIPNLVWAKNKPGSYDQYVGNENKVLLVFERIGEVLVSGVAIIFSGFNLRPLKTTKKTGSLYGNEQFILAFQSGFG